jgi:hypothetical protein
VALEDRLQRLEDDNPDLCEERPCVGIYHTEVELVGGEENLVKGTPPPPLCVSCPHRDSEARPINHVTVLRNAYAAPEDEATPEAQPARPVEPEPEDPYFAQLRQQAWEDDQERKALRRGPGGPQIRPEDFGL